MEFRQFIASLPAFEGLPAQEFDALLQVLHYAPHVDGYQFFTQGGSHEAMYVLLEGNVRVTHHDDSGTPVDSLELRSGEVFGLLGLVGGLPATATATATTPVGAVTLTREAYQWLFAAAPTLARRLQYMIAVQLARELQYRNRLLRARIRSGVAA
ncbi:MAG TPA: cyclic nucleotide-binding domain-containing protein [Rhodocyclaceae bacterium]|jgi:CRP-like cAMP-binding protein|nr:cyclic nucleotide-binding domain-containing protein [Rhodocyclaceae bacterium]